MLRFIQNEGDVMLVHVGSKNPTKVDGVRDALALYPQLFPSPEVIGVKVETKAYGHHPRNLEETLEGAKSRASQAFALGGADYGIGLEGGLMAVPCTLAGHMETNVCAVYNGAQFTLGISPSFEWPPTVTQMILNGTCDASEAFKRLGLTEHEKLGAIPGGITGLLTDQRMPREAYCQYAIIMALIRLDKPELYAIP